MAMMISSQRFADDAIIAAKVEAEDFTVLISPAFEAFGETVSVIIDGHHAYHAAILAGAKPQIVVLDASDNDTIALLDRGEIDDFLEVQYNDSDYYNIATGRDL